MPSRKCSCHSQASEKTCLLAASPSHSLTCSTWLWYPPRPSEWSRLPSCLIPCRQTSENVALFILLTSLASHPVKITSIPYPKDGSRHLPPGLELPKLDQVSCGASEQGTLRGLAVGTWLRAPGPLSAVARDTATFRQIFCLRFYLIEKSRPVFVPGTAFLQFPPKCQIMENVTIMEKVISP